MTAGRKRTPTQIRVLEGNRSFRPLPQDEPELIAEIPNPPEHLTENAKKHWATLTKQLHGADILTRIDGQGLEMLCEAYANWIEANNNLRIGGLVVEDPITGVPKQSPYASMADKYFHQMRQMLIEFGMTPSARARVKKAKDAKPSGDGKSRFFKD